MKKYEVKGTGVLGTTVELNNAEMTFLRDEVEDMFELLEDVGIQKKAIADKFSKDSAEFFKRKVSQEQMRELFKNLRNVYHFLNEITYNTPGTNKLYESFFGIQKEEEDAIGFDWDSLNGGADE